MILVALALGGCASQPMPPADAYSALPTARLPAQAPAGFVSFCLRFPDQCRLAAGTANVVKLDAQNWQTLVRVNRDVNDAIWPQEDAVHYGRAEYWTIPTDGYGDCDDYAVTKRKNLADAGLPLSALRLAVVYSARSGRHAVLTVVTDEGDFVLDNLSPDILPWDKAGYVWIERQDGGDPFRWVSLQQPTTVAQRSEPAAVSVADAGQTATSGTAKAP